MQMYYFLSIGAGNNCFAIDSKIENTIIIIIRISVLPGSFHKAGKKLIRLRKAHEYIIISFDKFFFSIYPEKNKYLNKKWW